MAIYISYRLSSCKFCDKTLVERGELTEYGTHQELVNPNSEYTQLWNTQAKYYA